MASVFATTLMFQLRDSAIFHGYLSGTYMVKIYPLALALVMGWSVLKRYQEQRERMLMAQHLVQQTTQVAHDIRSPLAALRVVMAGLSEAPAETQDLARRAFERIRALELRKGAPPSGR